MRTTISTLPAVAALPFALAALASAALPGSTAADAGQSVCVAPNVVGVSYARARDVLRASGCHVATRQLPAHDQLVSPQGDDSRQLVGAQSPGPGVKTVSVTVSLRPLCSQPAAPGPDSHGSSVSNGPTELIAGLFVEGGPLMLSPRCRRGSPSAGQLTVTAPGGKIVSRRSVRAGHYGVFPLKPGRYLLSGTFAGPGNRPTAATPLTIVARRTTHLDIVTDVP